MTNLSAFNTFLLTAISEGGWTPDNPEFELVPALGRRLQGLKEHDLIVNKLGKYSLTPAGKALVNHNTAELVLSDSELCAVMTSAASFPDDILNSQELTGQGNSALIGQLIAMGVFTRWKSNILMRVGPTFRVLWQVQLTDLGREIIEDMKIHER